MDKWVLHVLNENHKSKHSEILSAHLLLNQNDPFLIRHCNTCDEKWILYDNHKHSEQWLDADKAPHNTSQS